MQHGRPAFNKMADEGIMCMCDSMNNINVNPWENAFPRLLIRPMCPQIILKLLKFSPEN